MDQQLPARRAPTEGDFDTRPEQVERWLAELPRANVGETTRRLFQALNETNALILPSNRRQRMLELMRPVVHEMLLAMQKHYLGARFPLPDRTRRIASLARSLLNQMATGYRIVLSEESRRPRLLRDGRNLHVAAHRAMNYLSLALRQSYLVYAPAPRGIWHELHQLYQMTRELHLDRGRHPPLPEEHSAETVTDLYKQTLLLALVCPYRLRQDEMRWIDACLAHSSHAARLHEPGEPEASRALFVVQTEGDEPPGYLALRRHLLNGGDYYLLDTSDMASTFEREADSKETPPPPRTTTLQRALLAWGIMPKRRFSRRGLEARVDVAMGLSATHHFLTHGQEQDCLAESAPAHFEAREPDADPDASLDVWELAGTPRWRADDEVRMVDLPETFELHPERILDGDREAEKPTTSSPRPAPLERWQMSDISAGGFRLLWENEHSSRAEVGELVGILERPDQGKPTLSLGVVRWMKCGERAELELGIEMIAPGGSPVGARPEGSDSEFLPGLLLPELPAVHQPATLVLTTLPFRPGDRVEICTGSGRSLVLLTHLLENTGGFAQYEFRVSEAVDDDREDFLDAEAFEDLWKNL